MMAMTPRGTETLLTWSPLGRVWEARVRPTGSGRAATARTPAAMSAIRPWVRRRRSCITGEMVSWAAARSRALAARMAGVSASRASAMDRRTAFFSSVERAARAGLAASASSSRGRVMVSSVGSAAAEAENSWPLKAGGG